MKTQEIFHMQKNQKNPDQTYFIKNNNPAFNYKNHQKLTDMNQSL